VHRVSAGDNAAKFFGMGFELGCDWLLGADKDVSIGSGAGATRLFGKSLDGVSLNVATVRLVNVGWSFWAGTRMGGRTTPSAQMI
jgi:hypothetical protein